MHSRVRRHLHHHVEKKDMIHKLLAGRSGLSVWEPCAFKNSGAMGEASKAFMFYADAEKHVRNQFVASRQETDWEHQLRAFLLCNRKFDVIDLDGYGGPERLLMAGAVSLLEDGGLLFATFPLVGAFMQFPGPRAIIEGAYGKVPSIPDRLALVMRTALLHGYAAELKSITQYEKKVLRVAFSCTRIVTRNMRMQPVRVASNGIKSMEAIAY